MYTYNKASNSNKNKAVQVDTVDNNVYIINWISKPGPTIDSMKKGKFNYITMGSRQDEILTSFGLYDTAHSLGAF